MWCKALKKIARNSWLGLCQLGEVSTFESGKESSSGTLCDLFIFCIWTQIFTHMLHVFQSREKCRAQSKPHERSVPLLCQTPLHALAPFYEHEDFVAGLCADPAQEAICCSHSSCFPHSQRWGPGWAAPELPDLGEDSCLTFSVVHS